MKLHRDLVLVALGRLASRLSPADFDHLRRIAGGLDKVTSDISVAEVVNLLYGDRESASANKAFERLRSRLADAAEDTGVSLRLEVRGAKKLGGARRASFAGDVPIAATPEMREIEEVRTRLSGELIDQNARPFPPVIVILTVNDNETQALLDAFLGDGKQPSSAPKNSRTYDDLGNLGEYHVVHAQCEAGALAAQARTIDAINDWHPEAVFAVGVAFGADDSNQAYGDVLVANQIVGYEKQRVNEDGSRIAREGRTDAPNRWLQFVRRTHALGQRAGENWPKVTIGPLLSGQKLIDYKPFRDQLIADSGVEVVGGEMEGSGLVSACQNANTGWLLIKGIADFADGNKPEGNAKKAIQYDAAFRAAWIAKWVIEGGNPLPPPAKQHKRTRPGATAPTKPAERPFVLARADTQDLDDTAGFVAENPARPTALDAHQLAGEEPARRETQEGKSALDLLKAWLADPNGAPFFAVLGEYGMGKTIVCQRLTREMEKAQADGGSGLVPLYFDLKKLTGLRTAHVDASGVHTQRDRVPTRDEVLRECMQRGWRKEPGIPDPTPADVDRAVAQGALVIFDGLDEALVHLSPEGGLQFTDELLRILPPGGKSRSRVLVSCRTHFFRSLRDQHTHLMERGRADRGAERFGAMLLLPFSEAQIEEYLRHAFPQLDTERALETIRSIHNLGELVARPYLLRQIGKFVPRLEQWRAEGRKVQGVTLYREIVRDWLDRDSAKHHLRPEHKLSLAADLAAEFWRRGQRLFPASELESWFHAWRRSQTDPLRRYDAVDDAKLEEDLRNSHFLVREDGASEKESGFRFAHTSLMEFFLAEYLLQAIRDDLPSRWAMPIPSNETLDFLGQLIVESDDAAIVRRLGSWRTPYRGQMSELLLKFSFDCYRKGRPTPNLRGADLRGANLARWDLRARPTTGSPRLDLSGARFDGANLREAVFEGLRLEEARFDGARLERAELHDCRLERASFAGARLHGATLRHCTAGAANWSDAAVYRTSVLRSNVDEILPGMLPAPDPRGGPPRPRRLAVLRGHSVWVTSCAFSPDGAAIVSGGQDGAVRLWNAASGEARTELKGHFGGVWSCAFSPDGAAIVSGGQDGTVRLWDAASGEARAEIDGHSGPVLSCTFSPDSAAIVSGGQDGTVRLWDAASGEARGKLKGHYGRVLSCAFSPDGASIVSGGEDGTVRLWDVSSGEARAKLKGHSGGVRSCMFSSDSATIVSGGDDGMVRLWDAASGEVLAEMKGHSGRVWSCAFSPNGAAIVSGDDDGAVRLWDAASGEAWAKLKGHFGGVRSCAFSPDGTAVVSGGYGALCLWDAASGEALAQLNDHSGRVWSCAFSPDGTAIVSGGYGALCLWDATSGEALAQLKGHSGGVWSCAFSPDGAAIVSGGDDGTVRLWDTASGEARAELKGHVSWVKSCAFSPDGAAIVSGGDDGTVRLWNASSGERRAELKGHFGWVRSCAFSPDGTAIVSGGDDGAVRLWDAASGEARAGLKGHSGWVWSCAFSPDGAAIVSGGEDGMVRLWDVASGKARAKFKGHSGGVRSCAFSPDGAAIVSGGVDGTVRLWDVASGQARAELTGHSDWVWSCAFSPDGAAIVSGSQDGTVRLWDAATGEPLLILYQRVRGTAAWDPRTNQLLHARGEVWRDLRWIVPGEEGGFDTLPLETFGDLVQEWETTPTALRPVASLTR